MRRVADLIRRTRRRGASGLPSGTLTFVLTDIEGSTRLWETAPDDMERAVPRHVEIIERAVDRYGGVLVRERGEGDSTFSVFTDAVGAVSAVLEAQRGLHAESWPDGAGLRVRAAVHTGDARFVEGDYTAPAINRCARIRALGHGGQTLVSGRTAGLVETALPPGASLLDLGAHRLRDLTRPERLFQLCHPDLAAGFPDLRSLDSLPHNLPHQLTSFIGRERERDELLATLASNRLVCLVGPGGIGKTRLALQIAAERIDDFADGVWFADLAPARTVDDVERAVAVALGLREQPGRPLRETLLETARGLRVLLVLDNCEQVVAAASELAADVVRTAGDVTLLATSREPLTTNGCATYRLGPLPVPDAAEQDVESIEHADAVQLFVDRAALARGRPIRADASVGRVCRRLEGIPLAIELAAARASVLSAEEIAARLDDRLDLLAGGDPANPRHATLRAAIDWSNELLDDDEQLLLRRVAVFAGGFTVEAAEEVAAPDAKRELLDRLGRLVERSLLQRDADDDGGSRFTMLETIREYASEALDATAEALDVRDRHAAYFAGLAERAESGLDGRDQGAWYRRLEQDHDNMRRALAHARDTGDHVLLGRLASALWFFWFVRGYWREGRAWLAQALASDIDLTPSTRAKLLNGAGGLAQCQGDYEESRRHHEAALAILRDAGDPIGIADTIGNLAKLTLLEGDAVAAHALAEESAAMLRDAGDEAKLIPSLNTLAEVKTHTNDLDGARRLHEEALAIARVVGDERQIARSSLSLGIVTFSGEDLELAQTYLDDAIGQLRAMGDQGVLAYGLFYRGEVARQRGDLGDARPTLAEALTLARRTGDGILIPNILRSLGSIDRHLGTHGDARRHLEEAIGHLRRQRRDFELVATSADLAEVAVEQGDVPRARSLLIEALDRARSIGDDDLATSVEAVLASVAGPDDPAEAAGPGSRPG